MNKNKRIAIPPEQMDLPVAFDASGKTLLTPRHLQKTKETAGEFAQLSPEQKAHLTAERIQRLPKFELAMVGAGLIDKARAIREVQALSPVGRQLIEIEERTINLVRGALEAAAAPAPARPAAKARPAIELPARAARAAAKKG